MRRGEFRRLVDSDRVVLVLSQEYEAEGYRAVRIAPVRPKDLVPPTDRDLILTQEIAPFEGDVCVEFWNSRQIPSALLGDNIGTLPKQAVPWVLELLKADIWGQEPQLPDHVLGSSVPCLPYQHQEAQYWDARLRDYFGAWLMGHGMTHWRAYLHFQRLRERRRRGPSWMDQQHVADYTIHVQLSPESEGEYSIDIPADTDIPEHLRDDARDQLYDVVGAIW